MLIVMSITGIFGNLSVCCVILRIPGMRSATNYYLFSLAVADLLIVLLGKSALFLLHFTPLKMPGFIESSDSLIFFTAFDILLFLLFSYILFQIAPTIVDILVALVFFGAAFNGWFALIVFLTMSFYIGKSLCFVVLFCKRIYI